ncbi:hypothetical protein [Kitasatospora acidiphila]|uniref:hypothetical protein n=1 Tax=Kitasatospora acidiphila TaxID=2567942 RepID=UPI003C78D3B5
MADTTMDPAAVQAAGAAAEQLSTQVSGFKPQLASNCPPRATSSSSSSSSCSS